MDTNKKQDWVEITLSTRKLPVETGWLYETTKGITFVEDLEAAHVKILNANRKVEASQPQKQCSAAPVSQSFKSAYGDLSWPNT